ncbi:MAG: cytochrome c biogenesis protein CcsA [Planctomycetes bacterium]|nr:cytochrome c biogenesis protein CcsA [Planctomycetota bacterium]
MNLATLIDTAQIPASERWSGATDLVCLLGAGLCALAGWFHARAALRKTELAPLARWIARGAVLLLLAAVACMGASVWNRGLEVNHFPSQTMSEVLQMFSLAVLLSMFVLHFALGLQRRGSGWAIVDDAMMLCVFLGAWFTHRYIATLSTAQRDLPPALQSYWFPPHLSALIFSYATMGVAAVVALVWFVMRFWSAVHAGRPMLVKKLLAFVLLSSALSALGAAALRFGLAFEWAPALLLTSLPAGLVAWAFVRGVLDGRLGGPSARSELAIVVGLTLVPFVQLVTLPMLAIGGLVFALLRAKDGLPSAARLAELEKELDDVSFRAFAVGIPFLTAGLWMGAFWAQEAWANYWGWDSKENAALITWLVYIVYIHLRMLGGWRGSKAMGVLVAGALSVFVTFQVFGYFPDSQKSMHRYTDDGVKPMEGQQAGAAASDEQARADTGARDAEQGR